MDFEYLYIKFYKLISIFKNIYTYICISILLFLYSSYLYIDNTLKKESALNYINYINKKGNIFLEKEQYGIYETIRRLILSHKNRSKEEYEQQMKNLINYNPLLFERLNQLNIIINSDDNRIFKEKAELKNLENSRIWGKIFLTARLLNAKTYENQEINLKYPEYLINFIRKEKS